MRSKTCLQLFFFFYKNDTLGHIQSIVAAPSDVRDELEKYKNSFMLLADKVKTKAKF